MVATQMACCTRAAAPLVAARPQQQRVQAAFVAAPAKRLASIASISSGAELRVAAGSAAVCHAAAAGPVAVRAEISCE